MGLIVFLLVMLVASATAIVLLSLRTWHWKKIATDEKELRRQVTDRAAQAVLDRQAAREDYTYLKQAITGLMKKPIVAMLSDEQFLNLTNAILAYANAGRTDTN